MPWSVFDLYANWPTFLLVLFRIAGLTISAPIFSASLFPMQVKLLLTLAIAAAVYPLAAVELAAPITLNTALVGMVGELVIGLLIGFSLALMFLGVQLAAEMVSHQAGMSLGASYNPLLDTSESVFGQLYYFVAMMGFFAVGGHRELIRAIIGSFATVPPLAFKLSESVIELMIGLMTVSFEMAIRISGPTIVALMLSLLLLGFLSRTIPQLNILSVGFPLKLGVALLVMGLTVMSLEPLLLEVFETGMDGVRVVLGLPVQA